MKHSTQTLLLLLLFSLSLVTFAEKVVSVTKSFSTTKHYPPNSGSGSGSGGDNSGSNNEESPESESEPETSPPPPPVEGFQACDPDNRQQACTLEYLPVCSYVHNCEGGACTITSGNACSACAQSNVDGYVEGACEDIRNVCDPSNRPNACPLNYVPTCAVAGDCQGSNCLRDTSNGCEACSLQGVAYSLPGSCPPYSQGDRTFCDPNDRPEICTLDYTPVCAHIANCVGNSCYFTAGNACSACGDSNVNWHTPGECSADESRTYCDPNDRPEVCTADYTPVCAHRASCEGDDDCFFTAGNACSACGDATVDWHYPGECPEDNNNDDDERTYCDANARPEICTADYTPVCAHRAGCEGDNNCFFTAGNACSACGDATVDWHTPGEC